MKTTWPLRSLLFVPAHKLDWVRKTERFRPDGVILDLEDSVVASEKDAARATIAQAIGILASLGIAAVVRINAWDEGGRKDVEACVVHGLAGIMLPKARTAAQVRELDLHISFCEGRAGMQRGEVAILPLPETAEGLLHAHDLAAASDRVVGIASAVTGITGGDIARAAGFRPTAGGAEQQYIVSKMVLDSFAAGKVHPIAGIVGVDLDDLDTVRAMMKRVRAIGFSGVALVHPSHIGIAHEIFTPAQEDVDYFLGVMEAMRAARGKSDGAITYKGKMVDEAMVKYGQEILEQAARFGVPGSEGYRA